MINNISDRDKKIILALFIVIVLFLPYVFYVKDTRIKTDNLKVEIKNLESHLQQLQEMDRNRSFYLSEIDRYHSERDTIIASFPAGILPENYTMFLLNMENDSFVEANNSIGEKMEEAIKSKNLDRLPMVGIDGNTTLIIDTVAFGNNEELQISAEGAEQPLNGITNISTITYKCFYDGLKYMLTYLMDAPDPMIYKSIDMSFDQETAKITGSIVLEQYAIAGGDRVLPAVIIDPDLDDNKIRGNEIDGIFGPMSSDAKMLRLRNLDQLVNGSLGSEVNAEGIEGEEGVDGAEGAEGAEGAAVAGAADAAGGNAAVNP